MKNTTWVFGSMLAAGCMLLSVPVAAQGNFPQGNFPQGNFPQGNFPQGMGRAQGFPAGGPAATNQPGAKNAQAAGKTNTTSTTKGNTAKNEKSALDAAKYQLSNHRTDLIKATIDGYAASEDLSDQSVVLAIMDDIEKNMPLIPTVPLEPVDHQALNEKAKAIVDQIYGADNKEFTAYITKKAEDEFPLYKLGDMVVVNYNMGPKRFSVHGKLYRVTEKSITVEDKIINFVDLNDETRSRFDPQKNKIMRARFVDDNISRVNRDKIDKIQENYDKLKNEITRRNEAAGYICDPQTEQWSTAQEIAKNYIDRQVREAAKQRAKQPGTTTATTKTNDDATETGSRQDAGAAADNSGKTEPKNPTETTPTVVAMTNDSIKIEDNAESQERYQSVLEKAEERKNQAYENDGIDADAGYKNACWGFTISDARYALWREPEFPYIKPELGRDVITIPDEGLDLGIEGKPESIELVYISNSLSKVVYIMKDCSRQDFLRFKDSLVEQYGRAIEDKGVSSAAFTNIFSGKTKPQQIVDAAEIEEARANAKDAQDAFNKALADLKNASDEDREELQEKRDKAAQALKAANAKAETYENAVSPDNLPYIYTRINLAKDSEGKPLLPFAFNWKGSTVSGTLIFYYDKTRDKVTDLVFAKEFMK